MTLIPTQLRALFIFLFFPLFLHTLPAQRFFEGEVTYRIKYQSDDSRMSTAQLRQDGGEGLIVSWKKGLLHEKYKGGFVSQAFYSPEEVRLYIKMDESDPLLWHWKDASTSDEKLLSMTRIRDAAEVNGLMCDELRVVTEEGAVSYWYHRKYRVKARKLRKCKHNNWGQVYRKMRAVPQRIIMESTPGVKVSLELQKIENKAIPDERFQLPENAKTVSLQDF
jgi:hypothetical protein